MRQLKILLLTNCDSDNLGDQVIKASDIGLLHVVMRNLGWDQNEYRVISKPAAIVSKKYIETKDVSLLTTVNKTIASCDMILFGGAPMFNYRYQIFYERTATILDLAEKYHKPVVFSAIGIESYDEQDERCQRLKSALHQRCVKQITTRDGLEELKQYSANQTIPLGKVADPAVFSSSVFRKWRTKKEAQEQHRTERKIGLFVLRGGGFKDNGYDLSREDAKKLWVSLVQELKERGFRYELLTSGHFGDEAFLDALIRDCNIPASHCVFNMNTPEQLIEKIASYDAILSTRLHPSIISYSLGVPALSLIWNNKVERFYENIGYPDRAIPVTQFNPGEVADRLQEIIQLGVKRDPEYMISVYESLFEGVRQCLSDLTSQETCQQHDADALPYDYETVCRLCPDYPGTSDDMLNQKLVRKFRRTYSKYNALHHSLDRSGEQKKGILTRVVNKARRHFQKEKEQEAKSTAQERITDHVVSSTYTLHYHSGRKDETVQAEERLAASIEGQMKRLKSGALECTMYHQAEAMHPPAVPGALYRCEHAVFAGWILRFRIGVDWYWYLEDDSFCFSRMYDAKKQKPRKLFASGDSLPVFSITGVQSAVAEAVWEEEREER